MRPFLSSRNERNDLTPSQSSKNTSADETGNTRPTHETFVRSPSPPLRTNPLAKQHFDFGRSLTLPESTLFNLLHALFETLSSSSPLFLIFHDARSDLRSLQQLGFDVASFARGLGGMAKTSGVSVIDTQSLYSGWTGVNKQIRLETCCQVLEVPTKRLHNAG